MVRFKGQRGMSLVEVTIILLVLMLLTSVLAPSIEDYVNDAKDVKVKEDCEAIGTAIKRLERDVPAGCIKWKNGDVGLCKKADRADLLFTEQGNIPDKTGLAGLDLTITPDNVNDSTVEWDSQYSANNVDTLDHQLVTNTLAGGGNYPTIVQPTYIETNKNQYPGVGGFALSGPQFNRGWRGSYVSDKMSADPWGNRYMVNSVYLKVANDADKSTKDGFYGWNFDTFCISAGPNLKIETPFTKTYTARGGDDFTYTISGSSR